MSTAGRASAANNDDNRAGLHFVVVVLGDLGRSPRMMYHVLSLLEQQDEDDEGRKRGKNLVTFIGYTGEQLIPALTHRRYQDRLRVVRFPAPKLKFLKRYLLPVYFLWRIVSLTVLLVLALFFHVGTSAGSGGGENNNKKNISKSKFPHAQPPDCVLVQNPPAIPLLAVAAVYCHLYKAGLVIDWHNLGYSMIASTKYSGTKTWTSAQAQGAEIVGIYQRLFRFMGKLYEKAMAPLADGHLTVTESLKQFLISDMGINDDDDDTTISVLHDCPPAIFRLRTLTEQHRILMELDDKIRAACPESWFTHNETKEEEGILSQTLFTEEYAKGRCRPRRGRPALIVSSTSWTPDEDISLLLDALQVVEAQIQNTPTTNNAEKLKIVCVITGKGPLKDKYEQQIETLRRSNKLTQHVALQTLWVEPRDYPAFLACADLGVSLHTSTSKLDLPIKILDYFGCEVPVCAFQFSSTLKELVQDDVNGRTFTTSDELAVLLWDLLSPLQEQPQQQPLGQQDLSTISGGGSDHSGGSASGSKAGGVGNHDFGALKRYSRQVQGRLLWSENWPKNAWPVLRTVATKYNKSHHQHRLLSNNAATTTTGDQKKKN